MTKYPMLKMKAIVSLKNLNLWSVGVFTSLYKYDGLFTIFRQHESACRAFHLIGKFNAGSKGQEWVLLF